MDDAKIIEIWKPLVDEHGLQVFSRKWLDLNKKRSLMNNASKSGYKTEDIARLLGKSLEAFAKEAKIESHKLEYLKKWKIIIEEHGFQAMSNKWTIDNGYKSLWVRTRLTAKLTMMDITQALGKQVEFEEYLKRISFDFEAKTSEEIIDLIRYRWKLIYDEHGIKGISSHWARSNGFSNLASWTLKMKLNPEKIADTLDILKEFKESRRCTQEKYDRIVQEVIDKYGCLPQADFLTKNGYSIIATHIREFGISYKALRDRFNVSDVKLQALNGMYVDSFAECAFINYLYAHGIQVNPPARYPEQYSIETKQAYGKYDPGFVATHGELAGREVLVEIFGGSPGGNSDYARVQKAKMKFNERYDNFLAIDYLKCYSDQDLANTLRPFIGDPPRLIFDSKIIEAPAIMLSRVDNTLKRCQEICEKMPDGLLPPVTWFNRNQKYKNRTRADWEPDTWSGLTDAVNRLGWPKVRLLMKRTDKQIAFERAPTLKNVAAIYDKFGISPTKLFNRWCHNRSLSDEDRRWFNLAYSTSKSCKRLFENGEKDALRLLNLL